MKNLNFIIATVALAAVGIFALAVYLPSKFDATSKAQMADFPKEIGAWKSTDIKLDEKSFEILETRNLIMREYSNNEGKKVYLYIIYSEQNTKVVHPPELCYSGGGATIVEKKEENLTAEVRANKMVVEELKSRQMVYYWFKAGKNYYFKYLKMQFDIVMNLLRGQKTSCALIRLSTVVNNNNDQEAIGLIKNFTKEIQPLLDKYVP